MKRRRGLSAAVRMVAVAAAVGAAVDATGSDAAEDAAEGGAGTDAVAVCAARGAAILAGNPVPSSWQTQRSLYNRLTRRCYVEMRVETPATPPGADRIGWFLYDGKSGELLAFAEIKSGQMSGRVFDLTHATTTFANGGWDDAIGYIRQRMTPP
jgi:hypothetical protein